MVEFLFILLPVLILIVLVVFHQLFRVELIYIDKVMILI